MEPRTPGFSTIIALPDPDATTALAAQIAAGLEQGDCVALQGDLGAGKTTLARAILRALGLREDVPSPTYTLVQSYETPRFPVHHIDLYRVERGAEIDELGLDDMLETDAVLVEWPERAHGRLPAERLIVALSMTGQTSRRATITGPSKWARHLRPERPAR
jgi:tRNA threonylcarbamoyl adenosine modification protein YjeE